MMLQIEDSLLQRILRTTLLMLKKIPLVSKVVDINSLLKIQMELNQKMLLLFSMLRVKVSNWEMLDMK